MPGTITDEIEIIDAGRGGGTGVPAGSRFGAVARAQPDADWTEMLSQFTSSVRSDQRPKRPPPQGRASGFPSSAVHRRP